MGEIYWVAAHTGLPCFYAAEPTRVTAGDRVLLDGVGLASDALAPPGTPTEYTVNGKTITLTRRDDGHALTDAWGRGRVNVSWLGDDPRELAPRVEVFTASSRRHAIPRWALTPGPPGGTLQASTESRLDTHALMSLAEARGPVIAVHSPAECETRDCDIPPVRPLIILSATAAKVDRVDAPEREWSLQYIDHEAPGAAPVVTWGEWAALGRGWEDMSEIQVAREVAAMP